MCVHKFYIFQSCGHSFFAPGPLGTCAEATFLPLPPAQHCRLSRKSGILTHSPFSSTCTPIAHPYRTIRVAEGLCLKCELKRNRLLAIAEQDFVKEVRFDETKWRVQYANERKKSIEGDWSEWGEHEQEMSVEQMVKQRQKDRSGRVGFLGDSVKSPAAEMQSFKKLLPPPPPPPKGPAKGLGRSSRYSSRRRDDFKL